MGEIELSTDSDWAGCRKTRKSTSGGVLKVGRHVIKSWSRTQKAATLSSGEAEVIAVVGGVSEALGVKALAKDWGLEYDVVVLCDSSAAVGIVGRKGVGRIRHLDVGAMWVQQLKEGGGFDVKKVKGTENPADQMTKYLGAGEVEKGVEMLGMEFREGRADGSIRMAEGWKGGDRMAQVEGGGCGGVGGAGATGKSQEEYEDILAHADGSGGVGGGGVSQHRISHEGVLGLGVAIPHGSARLRSGALDD